MDDLISGIFTRHEANIFADAIEAEDERFHVVGLHAIKLRGWGLSVVFQDIESGKRYGGQHRSILICSCADWERERNRILIQAEQYRERQKKKRKER